MRKLICTILIFVLLLSVGIPAALAAHHGRTGLCNNANINQNACVKQNQDADCQQKMNQPGICTKCTDADDDGICDNRMDANKDGICDNWVDEDGDGICDQSGNKNGDGNCDNRNASQKKHHGTGANHGHGGCKRR